MTKFVKGSRASLDPATDWRIYRVEVVDHWTAQAWEINGLGDKRAIRGLQQFVDPDYERRIDEYYDLKRERWAQERAAYWKAAEKRVGELRRRYAAQGRVLTPFDLKRELAADFEAIGKSLVAKRPEPVEVEGPVIRLDGGDEPRGGEDE